jgi:hypothetical protein
MVRRPFAVRSALALSAVALAGSVLVGAGPAAAHAGDGLAQPILESMTPTVAGITVEVAFSATYQLIVSNTTSQAVTFLADSGEPFLEIGPGGVRGNFASPTFLDSNVPSGRDTFPPQAKPGADVPPIWRKLATQPNWGWYDHRLHPTESYISPEMQRAGKTVVLGRWRVPLRLGDQAGELQGRIEYRPPKGAYNMVQKSSTTPADGVTIEVVSASVVPALFVKNESPEPVVVLGKNDEPFARIGPKVSEVNVRSPTWAEIQQAQGKDPSDEVDPKAQPEWRQVAPTPAWNWLEVRAAAPKTDPPQAVIDRGKATTVRTWSISYVIGTRRGVIEGVTEFVPIAELRKRAAGGAGGGGSGGGSNIPLYAGVAVAAAVLGGAAWLVTSKVRNRPAA